MKYILAIIFSLALATPAFASTTGWQPISTNQGSNAGSVITGTGNVLVIAEPTAKPTGGTYHVAQSVALSAVGATSIHYMFNKNVLVLTCNNGTVYDSANPVQITVSGLLRAIACYGSKSSQVSSFTYVIGSSNSSSSGNNSGTNTGGGVYTPIPTTTPLIGDINGDGVVNILDFNALLVQWGKTGSDLSADLNHDGVVGILDFNILIIHWHQTTK